MSCPVRRCGPSGPASPVPCRRGCSCHVPGPGGPLHRKRSTWPSASSSTLSCRRTALFGPTCDDRGTGLPSWVSSHPVSTHKLRVLTTVQHLFPRSARDRRLTGALAQGWHWCDPRRPSGETSVWQVPRPAQPRHGSAPQVSVDMCVAEPGTTGPRRSGCRQVNPAGPAAPRTFSVPPISTATFAARVDARVSTQPAGDRKSTRLNSSHSQISYAVFCLKKKKKKKSNHNQYGELVLALEHHLTAAPACIGHLREEARETQTTKAHHANTDHQATSHATTV